MSEHVLVVNAGSSSIKYQLIDVEAEEALAVGLLERIGQPMGAVRHDGPDGRTSFEAELPDHEAGVRMLLRNFAEHGPTLDTWNLVAVGHRVVQGGDRFSGPAVVDEKVEADIEDLCTLGPLHNPAHLAGIRAARKAFPDVPHVVVFDTSFHTTLPPEAYTYAIDRELARAHAIRRYGAHGTSHKYVSQRVAELMEKPYDAIKTVTCHLGNGSCITAVCVSVCGVIGFIGLVVPHLLRFSLTSDNRMLMPLSALFGAFLLCGADNVTRLISNGEIPVGVLTTLLGGPFFIYIFVRRKGSVRAE